MNRLLNLLAVVFLYSSAFAQQKKENYKKTESGLEYLFIKKGKGEKTKKSYRVYVNFTTRINPDSVFDSNTKNGKPYHFILGQEEVLKGWDEAISLLSVGDSAHFKIPPTLAYGSKKLGSIPANTTLLLEVKVLKIEQAFYDLTNKDTINLTNGLKKILIQKGTEEKPTPYHNVTLQFTGYIYNKKGYKSIFQSSYTNSTVAIFQLGAGRMLKGLDEGIKTMNIGEKATFIVPPHLGFGKEASGIVPGNSTLFFDIELISSKDPFYSITKQDSIVTKSGIKIIPIQQKEGKTLTCEDVVSFDYIAYFIDSLGHPIIFDNTIERQTPIVLRPGSTSSFIGLSEALGYLKKDEKAKIYIPSKLGFGKNRKGIIPPNSTLIYDVNILNTMPYPFFETKGLDTIKKASGLKYIPVKKGNGIAVDTNNFVSISYTGFVIDSLGHRKIFDASRENHKMLDFVIGTGTVIKGFDEGVNGMTLGEARRLIIPYELGYGEKGLPEVGIPQKTTIYFDIELIEIKKDKK